VLLPRRGFILEDGRVSLVIRPAGDGKPIANVYRQGWRPGPKIVVR